MIFGEAVLTPLIFQVWGAPQPAAASKPAGRVGWKLKGAGSGRDSRTRPPVQADRGPEPQGRSSGRPGALPGTCPRLSGRPAYPLDSPATPCGFASQHLPRSAEHGTAASWAQEKWLLYSSNEDSAHAARRCCGTPAAVPDPTNPQRLCTKGGSENVVTHGHVTATPPLACDSSGDNVDRHWVGSGRQGPAGPDVTLGFR